MARLTEGRVTYLNSGDFCVARAAQNQKVAQGVGEFGRVPDRANVMTFQPLERAAVLAPIIVTFQRGLAQKLPPIAPAHLGAVAHVFLAAAHVRTCNSQKRTTPSGAKGITLAIL